jgi:hypothetical protein
MRLPAPLQVALADHVRMVRHGRSSSKLLATQHSTLLGCWALFLVASGTLGCAVEAPTGACRGGVESGPTVQFSSVLVHAVNDGVLRPSPAYDFDRLCTPALFVQDGAGPFSSFVLAECPPGVDSHSTFVLIRVMGEDKVNTVVARFYSFGVETCSMWTYCLSI